jgi:hypothetical protein
MKGVVVALAFFIISCESDPDATCICDGGGGPWDDGLNSYPPCDLIAQTGCEAGEKCTWQDVTDSLGRIACVPAGTVAIGGTCTVLAPGETAGYDDCVIGAYCLEVVCLEICTDAPDSCDTAAAACTVRPEIFGGANVPTGVCEPLR